MSILWEVSYKEVEFKISENNVIQIQLPLMKSEGRSVQEVGRSLESVKYIYKSKIRDKCVSVSFLSNETIFEKKLTNMIVLEEGIRSILKNMSLLSSEIEDCMRNIADDIENAIQTYHNSKVVQNTDPGVRRILFAMSNKSEWKILSVSSKQVVFV